MISFAVQAALPGSGELDRVRILRHREGKPATTVATTGRSLEDIAAAVQLITHHRPRPQPQHTRQLPLWDADAFAFIDDRIKRYRRPAISNGRPLSKREERFKAELDASNELTAFPRPTSDLQCKAIGLGDDIPCPFAGCEHHLGIDVMERTGSLRIIYPHWEEGADESVPTCALAFAKNVAPGDETNADQIAMHLGIGKNLVGRILSNALAKMAARMNMNPNELAKALDAEREERMRDDGDD